MSPPKTRFHYNDINSVFVKLIENCSEFVDLYNTEIKNQDPEERLAYIDIACFGRFIVEKTKNNDSLQFQQFFKNVEHVLTHGDKDVRDFIVVGLFESIQNNCASEIDYHRSFDTWLKNESLKEWRNLIDFWEGKNWRES